MTWLLLETSPLPSPFYLQLKRDAIRSGQTTTSNTEKIDELAEEQARRILKVL